MKKGNQNLKKIIIARLRNMPDNLELSIGGKGPFNKDFLIESVEADSEIGKQIVDIQWKYMQDMVSGKLYQNLL